MYDFASYNPKTLEDAISYLLRTLTPGDRDMIIGASKMSIFDSTFGRMIRNAWLWDETHDLSRHFRERFCLGHADDMSVLITNGVWAAIRGKEYDPTEDVISAKKHWIRAKIDPLTQVRID